jgi:hypothetical protein
MRVIPIDVYNEDGHLTKIEVQGEDGNHVIDVVWDDNDEQTSDNRVLFRQFAYRLLEQKGYEVDR